MPWNAVTVRHGSWQRRFKRAEPAVSAPALDAFVHDALDQALADWQQEQAEQGLSAQPCPQLAASGLILSLPIDPGQQFQLV